EGHVLEKLGRIRVARMRTHIPPPSFRGVPLSWREPGIHPAAVNAAPWIPGSLRFASRPGMTREGACRSVAPRNDDGRVRAARAPVDDGEKPRRVTRTHTRTPLILRAACRY